MAAAAAAAPAGLCREAGEAAVERSIARGPGWEENFAVSARCMTLSFSRPQLGRTRWGWSRSAVLPMRAADSGLCADWMDSMIGSALALDVPAVEEQSLMRTSPEVREASVRAVSALGSVGIHVSFDD